MELHNRSTVLSLLKANDKKALKELGQNFLIDEKVLNDIIETAKINNKDNIVEIGPGLGVLTQELCKNAKHVTSVELDTKLFNMLAPLKAANENLELIHGDGLRYEPELDDYKLVANIPYYITSPLINHFIQCGKPPKSLTLLIQKEVAEKIIEGEPNMSVLSLQVQLFGKAKIARIVGAGSFFPEPKVQSAIIHIDLFTPSDAEYNSLEEAKKILKIAKVAFSQKRKKLSNTLAPLFQMKNAEIKELFDTINISADRRPETLSILEWKKIIELLKNAS